MCGQPALVTIAFGPRLLTEHACSDAVGRLYRKKSAAMLRASLD